MSKEKKDICQYLHYYIGCEWKVIQQAGEYRSGTYRTDYFNSGLLRELSMQNVQIKPILRKLSSISKNEQKRVDEIYEDMGQPGAFDDVKFQIEVNAQITHYLLSKHFDLFGLIESELAIDKETLNP